MKRNSFPFIILIFFFFIGCTKQEDSVSDIKIPHFNKDLTLNSIDSLTLDYVFKSDNWKITKDRIFINQWGQDSLLMSFNRENGKLIEAGINLGQGPGEYIVSNPGDAIQDDMMLMYDIMQRKLFLYKMDLFTEIEPIEFELPVDEEGLALPSTNITQVSDSIFLLSNDSPSESYWELINLVNGKVLWRKDNEVRKPGQRGSYYFIQAVTNDRMAVVYKYLPLVQIYRFSDNHTPEIMANYGDAAYINNYNYKDGDIDTYLSIAVNDNILYCLKAGKENDRGNIVETFDLTNGKPIAILNLNREVESIRIAPIDKLIGLSPNEKYSRFYIWNIESVHVN